MAYTENWSVWTADDEKTDDLYVALFNTGEEIMDVSATFSDLGITDVKEIKDIWTGELISSENEKISVSLKPHASIMLKVK